MNEITANEQLETDAEAYYKETTSNDPTNLQEDNSEAEPEIAIEKVISELNNTLTKLDALLQASNDLLITHEELKKSLAASLSSLNSATNNCQEATNQINSTLKAATDGYNSATNEFEQNLKAKVSEAVNSGFKILMENVAKNYQRLHFSVEEWNKSGAIGGLIFLKYGILSVIGLQLLIIVILCLRFK